MGRPYKTTNSADANFFYIDQYKFKFARSKFQAKAFATGHRGWLPRNNEIWLPQLRRTVSSNN